MRMPSMPPEPVFGLLLAGGQARRMGGGDKCLLAFAGRTLLAHAIERLTPQVGGLVLNANGDPARFADYGLPVLADVVPGFAGPLAGVLTGMAFVRQLDEPCDWLVTAATDTPFFPLDVVARLRAAAREAGADIAFARSADRVHPVFGLWRVALHDALAEALTEEGERKIDRFAARYRVATAGFSAVPFDPFFNINRPEDLAEAGQLSEPVNECPAPFR
jgi:molybdopterin-guanine dinucleotide biosynthesis protein A